MGSSGKKKTTMAKMARENKLRERRAIKAAKKDARKQAAADGPPAPAALTDPSPGAATDTQADDARQAFLDVGPEPADPRALEVALTRLRESKEEELAVFGDMLRTDAREAGASEQELREAQQGHPEHGA